MNSVVRMTREEFKAALLENRCVKWAVNNCRLFPFRQFLHWTGYFRLKIIPKVKRNMTFRIQTRLKPFSLISYFKNMEKVRKDDKACWFLTTFYFKTLGDLANRLGGNRYFACKQDELDEFVRIFSKTYLLHVFDIKTCRWPKILMSCQRNDLKWQHRHVIRHLDLWQRPQPSRRNI